MIVVDGIPLETAVGADFDFATATEEEFSQLLNVAPADIKDIVVLKMRQLRQSGARKLPTEFCKLLPGVEQYHLQRFHSLQKPVFRRHRMQFQHSRAMNIRL